MSKLMRGTGVFLTTFWVLATLALIVTAITVPIVSAYNYKPEFKREVHGHVVNAYYANTPELMISELKAAKLGMQRLGLAPTLYDDMRPWKHTPDNRMDYQYNLIDSVIKRAEAVKADRDRQVREGTSDQLGDVYETKMDNLRDFIGPNSDGGSSGWIDSTSYGAFFVHKHPNVAMWYDFGLIWFLCWLGGTILCLGAGIPLVIYGDKRVKRIERQAEREKRELSRGENHRGNAL